MIRLEVLVEEPSAEEALKHILQKIVAGRARTSIHNMRSKGRLLRELPARLRGYRSRIERGEKLRILVIVDRDDDDCEVLKRQLEIMALDAGLSTKSSPNREGRFQVVNRIAVVELESWFIGDPQALRQTFSKLPARFPANFSNPDNGGTWERLHRFLRRHGIYKRSYPKIEAAGRIASNLEPNRNRSSSFRHFRLGVEAML